MSQTLHRAAFLTSRLDGAAMTGLGAFMGWLVFFGNYWMFLNPKFKAVTLAAACLLLLLGGYALVRPVTRPSLGRCVCWVLLSAMVLWVGVGGKGPTAAQEDPFMLPALPDSPPPATPARLSAGGREYIPINTGELYHIASELHSDAFDRPYAMRGFIHRDPALDASGEFVLFRLALWCCFADATAVGFRVKLPPGTPLPQDKAWGVVYGRLDRLPQQDAKEPTLPGMSFSSISATAFFAADAFEPATPQPEEIYMYEWRQSEPYAF